MGCNETTGNCDTRSNCHGFRAFRSAPKGGSKLTVHTLTSLTARPRLSLSYIEALSTAALGLLVRVVKYKPRRRFEGRAKPVEELVANLIAHEVHFCADEKHHLQRSHAATLHLRSRTWALGHLI